MPVLITLLSLAHAILKTTEIVVVSTTNKQNEVLIDQEVCPAREDKSGLELLQVSSRVCPLKHHTTLQEQEKIPLYTDWPVCESRSTPDNSLLFHDLKYKNLSYVKYA